MMYLGLLSWSLGGAWPSMNALMSQQIPATSQLFGYFAGSTAPVHFPGAPFLARLAGLRQRIYSQPRTLEVVGGNAGGASQRAGSVSRPSARDGTKGALMRTAFAYINTNAATASTFMTDNSAGLHESASHLKPETMDRHRAVASLMEELEAVDWYDQRIDAAQDPELREVLAHNRDEEKEHAAMVLEWLRRHDAKLDEHLRTYLFKQQRVLDIEKEAEHGDSRQGGASTGDGSLGIGSLRA